MHGVIGRLIFKWDEHSTEVLRKMLADGAHFREIGERLGCSKNACIGRARRMGFASHHAPSANPTPHKAHRKKREGRKFSESLAPYFNKWAKPPRPRPPDEIARVTFFDLKNTSCRFPIGDPKDENFGYCGLDEANQIEGRPYCPGHHGVVYQRGSADRVQRGSGSRSDLARQDGLV